jgi:hypothetical protein
MTRLCLMIMPLSAPGGERDFFFGEPFFIPTSGLGSVSTRTWHAGTLLHGQQPHPNVCPPPLCLLDKKNSRNRFEKMVWAGGELNYANGRPEPNQTAGSRVKTQAPDSWTPTSQHQGPPISGEGGGLYQRPPGLYTYRQSETSGAHPDIPNAQIIAREHRHLSPPTHRRRLPISHEKRVEKGMSCDQP